jgi:signal transduction histidine kinase/ActR/RegA family two-component response regulator
MELPPVVLVTPNETDARVGVAFLTEAGIAACAYGSLADLSRTALANVGCAVLVEEALVHAEVAEFLLMLASQPAWSDLPLVLVASEGTSLGALVESVFPQSGNMAVLERPLNPVTLVSAVRVGLRARHRQLEVRDLLEQRNAALRKRDEFLAMLGHELRNPLAPLRNAVYIMHQLQLENPTLLKARDLIDRQTAHLQRLVDDLLEVSRLELGKVNLQKRPLDLNAAVASAAEASVPVVTTRKQSLAVRLAPEALMVDADPVRIEQIIGNLLTNAAKFTPEGGSITVEACGGPDSARVTVSDTGIGLRADMLGTVFDLFAQDEHTLARAGGGLGIGLTIVKRLVELHGGTVSVVSDGPGAGSSFTVEFPRVEVTQASPTEPRDRPAVFHTKRVLVIEDNADIRESLGLMLRMWGHDVEFAETGTDGLERVRELKPDVALIDIGLPGLDGYELARSIREDRTSWARAVKLVALTGYGRESDRIRALEAGFDTHLVKPIDPEILARTLGSEAVNQMK